MMRRQILRRTAQALQKRSPGLLGVAAVRCFSSSGALSKFATLDPDTLSGSNKYLINNLVQGEWKAAKETYSVVDPLNGEPFIECANTKEDELQPFVDALRSCPKSGMHNPIKKPERYLMYGQVCMHAAAAMHDPAVADHFVKCIQRVMPKSYEQAMGEVKVTRAFLENFAGDNVRFLTRTFGVPGDHEGQTSYGMRFPYGPVCVVSPFNFPLEIPALQLMGAAMVGNKTTVKCQAAVGLPIEQFMRLLHACGLPKDDIDLISCRGPAMESLIRRAQPRMLQFTGSSQVSEQLNEVVKGRIRCEDSGYDWKVLGPDVSDIEYVAWQCDQDAYANAGQKCSAQSMLVAHSNWMKAGIVERLEKLAARRSLKDLTMGPCLSHTTEEILEHTKNLASLPGARLLFGGKEIEGHQIPKKYGAIVPTAVFVPLKSVMASEENFKAVTVELFGAFQVVTEWGDGEEDLVIAMLERMSHHLTAAVVSKDNHFLQRMLGNTVNGTTYAGLRARTTGAPQNHWFGPAGDSLAAGIGTREAILQTWTCHREIIFDHGPVPSGWTLPPPS